MKINFNENEIKVMKKAGVNFSVSGNLDNDDIFEIDNLVSEYLMFEGIDEEGVVNEEGHICEEILEKLSEEE